MNRPRRSNDWKAAVVTLGTLALSPGLVRSPGFSSS